MIIEWEGRKLTYLYDGIDGVEVYYTYNADGIRTQKEVNGTVTYYTLDGSKIISQKTGNVETFFEYDATGNVISMTYNNNTYYYVRNTLGDILGLSDIGGNLVVTYEYHPYGEIKEYTDTSGINLANINPFRYKGYYFDTETGYYYLNSRYYDPELCRFLNTDDESCLGMDGTPLSYNLFAYCTNNPVNNSDSSGYWKMPNWLKVTVGMVATAAAVAVTVATGGAAAPVLIGVAVSTVGGAAVSAVNHRVATGSWDGVGKAIVDGAADGFMTGGLCALGGSVIGGTARTIKNAKSGITIGKTGQFEKVAELAKTRHYSGLKEFNFIKKVAGQKAAETVGWWQNKCVVKGVMALKGSIYDCGGALTGAYAKEVALTKGYQYLYNVWLM